MTSRKLPLQCVQANDHKHFYNEGKQAVLKKRNCFMRERGRHLDDGVYR